MKPICFLYLALTLALANPGAATAGFITYDFTATVTTVADYSPNHTLVPASIRPNSWTQLSISASATASSAGEPARAMARPPSRMIAEAASAAALGSRPLTTTPAPHTASNSDTARPMPRLPPTTTAARPPSRPCLVTAAPVARCAHVIVEL